MGVSKKHAKGRLDKYYHMAKEQGYRARSAFKLIQLNKKYNLLEKAKVCVDLCAAPGGWLQVASKYMPKPSVIIGIDLDAIAPIPGVMTFVEDITTSKCRATLKRELKTWKADLFLHDGAPNVGTSWAQDAFFQSELTLSALKLATEFLIQGGTFVTKVFRSKDYNKLLWVFNQLFKVVEATKPSSSRNVSAEIFVVCRDFLAPKKIDPRLLDPAYVFKEVDDIDLEGKALKEKQGAVLNNIFHPEKRHRHRDGYQDGDYTLHQINSVSEFIESGEFLDILAKSSCLDFNMDDKSKDIFNHVLTTEEIKECCKDLKVIGKKDFKGLIKWRDSLRIDLGYSKSRKELEQERKLKEEEAAKLQDTDEVLAEKIAQESRLAELAQKKAKKKQKEKKMKHLMKLRLGMDTPNDIGMDASVAALTGDQEFDFGTKEEPLMKPDASDSDPESHQTESEAESEAESESETYDSDDEQRRKMSNLETEIDELFEDFLARKVKKSPSETVKKEKEGAKAKFEEWYGIEYDNKVEQVKNDVSEDSSEFSDSSSEAEVAQEDTSDMEELSNDAKMFFDNPVFKSLESENPSTFEKDMEKFSDESSDDNDILSGLRNSKKRKRSKDTKEKQKQENEIEVVPLEKEVSDDDGDYAIETAQEYALAQKLIRPSKRRDVLDEAYNRYAFNDPDLPSWFVEDESRHNKPTMPVTKEAVEIMKQKAKALDARPIKKVAEAKFRKQMRAQRRIDKMMKKAAVMNDDEDLTEKSKLSKIAEMMSKAKVKPKKEDKKPKLVIARGANRGNKGRPKGVKGRYKMVDSRMKKEVRAEKRKKAMTKKRRK